jgi:para-aminobenzoate synthetase component I
MSWLSEYQNLIIEQERVFICERDGTVAEPDGSRKFIFIPYPPAAGSPEAIAFNVAEDFPCPPAPEACPEKITVRPGMSKEEYIARLRQLKYEIQKGNVYEVNFCLQFIAEKVHIDPVLIFSRLQHLTQAPYSRLIKMADQYVISGSPELFLKRTGNTLVTKPIKGTVRRGRDEQEDALLKERLSRSLKERTENVMAVDVARNDLSRIAGRGTVKAGPLFAIESFRTVHQMVSTVSCNIKDECTFRQIIEATFPMASMTGAPKISAMKLIAQKENFERQGYSGAAGFMEENGNFELAVLIRSIFYDQGRGLLTFAAGSAITRLCDPEQEYEECLLKAKALLAALNADLIT